MTTEPTTATTAATSTTTTTSSSRASSRWLRRGRDIVVLLAVFGGTGEVMARIQAPDIGLQELAPPTIGATLEGTPFDLEGYRGRPVFVNLWATWCAPCRVELPELAAAARHHPEVQFLGLAMSSSNSELARHLIKEAGVDYPNVMVSPAVEAAWRVSSFPSSILLDEEGHVVWRRAGMVDHADIERALRELPGR